MVYLSRFGSRPATILLKYAGQWIRTARILRREKPDAIFVMTPPVFAALPAFWYARWTGARVVLDAHTAAFLHPRWRCFQWLQRALCRKAATTIVHNHYIAQRVRSAGGHATVVSDVPVIFSEIEPFAKPDAFTVAVVCSFNYDEPLPAILEAAAAMPGVRFFMTGNPRHLSRRLANSVPRNVTLTGFLSTAGYGGLLSSADVVLTLTTRDHTMLRGAYEAIYQGTPVIISDWPLLREAFPEGAVHVDNTAREIADAIRQVQQSRELYREQADCLRRAKLRNWQHVQTQLIRMIREGRRSDDGLQRKM
jgi:glycosyltransferase involved in cell wall biosynthesis